MGDERVVVPLSELSDGSVGDVSRLTSLAFGVTRGEGDAWIRMAGIKNWRVLREGGQTLACAMLIPMAQYLGGRSVDTAGIAAVTVSPEARGRGVARGLMAELMRELNGRGVPTSVLYSGLHPLYRSVGYETAGIVCHAKVPAAMLPATDRGVGWRSYADERDFDAVRACYAAYARDRHGFCDRGSYLWERVRRPRTGENDGFVATAEDGSIEAYVFYKLGAWDWEQPGTGTMLGNPLRVADMAWSTPRGLARLRGFLRGYASTAGEISFTTQAESALLIDLEDHRFRMKVLNRWMLRVTDVAAAVEARGFPRGLATEIHLEIADDVVPSNAGRWIVRADGSGAAVCERGGEGHLKTTARWFAPIYSGHLRASELAAAGRIDAGENALAACDALFGGFGAPTMVDLF